MAIDNATKPVPEPLPQDEQRKVSPSTWDSNDYALRIVRSDWAYAESYRINAHDWRYRNASELYLAWAGQRYWEGTRVPRSSLGVYVVFEQVEAMLPKLVSGVTSMENYHFTPDKPGGPDADLAAVAWRELVTSQLGEAQWREQVRLALKSMAVYGNGVIEVGVEVKEDEYISFDKSFVPKNMRVVNHPVYGQVPTFDTEERFKRKIQKERKLQPYVRYVSLIDLYVDPNCESTRLQNAGFVIERRYMRLEEVKALARNKGFAIPSDAYLTSLSHAKSTANQDVTKLSTELFRYNMWNPALDYTSDPAQKRIAVVKYTKKDRLVYWLQGGEGEESIIYNQTNPYGQINYYSVGYADVLDRWHALAVSDVAEGEQRLQQALINGRIDEVALAMHPPQIKRRGVTVPWYQLKRAPGRVVEVENPKEDIIQGEIANITQQAFVEVAASENRVQRITGLTDLAALGTPASGGNSANRTATGVNTQAGATQDRMKYILENIEDALIEPVVNFVIELDRKFLDLKQASNWLKLDPRFQNLDPVVVMNTKVSADCRASSKMAGRAQFLQMLAPLSQIFLNPEFLQLMGQQQQMALNIKTYAQGIQDALNYNFREPLFVPMSQQQIQAMQQPPAAEMMKMQLAQLQAQSDQQINQNNLQTKLLDTTIKEGFRAHTEHARLDDEHSHALLNAAVDIHKAESQAAAARSAGGAGKNSKSSK